MRKNNSAQVTPQDARMVISMQITVDEYHHLISASQKALLYDSLMQQLLMFSFQFQPWKSHIFMALLPQKKYWQNIKLKKMQKWKRGQNKKYLYCGKGKHVRRMYVSDRNLPSLPSMLDQGCVAMEVRSWISLALLYPSQHFWQRVTGSFLCSENALETALPPSQGTERLHCEATL